MLNGSVTGPAHVSSTLSSELTRVPVREISTKLAAGPPGSVLDSTPYVVSAGLPPVAGDDPGQFGLIGTDGAVSAANTVKCDVLPVMLLAVGLTVDPPSAGCHVAVDGSK